MRCLVTGATGFVGAHLVRWLLKQNCQVAVLIRPASNLWRLRDVIPSLHRIEGDLFDIARSQPLIQTFKPEVIFHLGWSSVAGSQRDDPSQVQNLHASLSLLQVAHACGCQCWIGLGSQAEYGCYDSAVDEDSPTHPETMYGTAKLCTALLTQKLCNFYNMRYVWLRLFAAYGPMDTAHFLIPYVIRTLLNGGKPVLTAGEQRWDYLFVEDAVRAVWQASITSATHGIFNLGSGVAVPVKQISERIRELIDPRLPIGYGEKEYSANQIMLLQAKVSRLTNATGWEPQISLDEGLRRTIAWYKSNASGKEAHESL